MVTTGRPDTTPDAPSHIDGIAQGNAPGNYEKQPGHEPNGRASARRSTGIDPQHASPIDPRMPNLPPA